MKWQHKASIMKICTGLPAGDKLYKFIQKKFGRLDANPMSRLQAQVVMARWILEQGESIESKIFFEVGTGHVPIVPIGFFLSGAESVISVDLHWRIDFSLIKKSLSWIAHNTQKIESMYIEIVDSSILSERLELIRKLQSNPKNFLKEANIKYLAPYNAANTFLSDESIDYHISNSVLEHITKDDIELILLEGKRILKHDGAILHFISLSDHFQHQDSSISTINFLRYSDTEWDYLAGNQFAYTNRLRASDFTKLFSDLSFKILKIESETDSEALTKLKGGLKINNKFLSYKKEDICITSLRVMLRRK